ncbi:polycystin-1 isoform X2 [Nematostella vectensis]|uniref:polycystin-1 isoform X2 n=1 Tax=Nematostella vectensis TaxID=45351 RepID=UPI00207752C4|nr:polycystin-1 isoform X2 [Nematostella vectensis]
MRKFLFYQIFLVILRTLSVRSAEFPFLGTSSVENVDSLYLGCFKEGWPVRDLLFSAGDYDTRSLDPKKCLEICGKLYFQYAGLQKGDLCFCGRDYGKSGVSNECDRPCSGDNTRHCGGNSSYSAYNSTFFIGRLSVEKSLELTELYSEVNLTVTFLNGTTTDVGYAVDLEDEIGYSTTRSTHQQFTFRTTRWGTTKIYLRNTISKAFKTTAFELRTRAGVKFVELDCPQVVTTNVPFICETKVYQGTDVSMVRLFNNEPPVTASLPDPSYVKIGNPVPQWSQQGVSSNFTGVLLVPSTSIRTETLIVSIEVYGVKEGPAKLFVATPLCNFTNQTYCPSNLTCIPVGTSCTIPVNTCSPTNVLSITKVKCGTSNCTCNMASTITTLPVMDYTIACELGTFNLNLGYNLFVLSDGKACKVKQGDVLGWVSDGGGQIGHRNGGKAYEISSLDSSHIIKGFNISKATPRTERHVEYLLKVIASEAVISRASHVLLSPGLHNYQVKLNNTLTPLLEVNRLVIAQVPAVLISPVYPLGFETFGALVGHQVELCVNMTSATNLSIVWRNASVDGEVIWEGFVPNSLDEYTIYRINHSLSTPGRYEIYVQASNAISSVNTTVAVLITNGITGLLGSLLKKHLTVYKGLAVVFNSSVASGDGVRYRWLFGSQGTVGFTASNTTTFVFHQTGTVNVTLIASNLAMEVDTSFLVEVEDPVTMTSSMDWAPVNTSVVFTCALKGNFDLTQYHWDFGDGTIVTAANSSNVTHTFSRGNTFTVSCRIASNVPLNSSVSILIIAPVTGLTILPFPGVEVNQTKMFQAMYTAGNNLTFEWCIQGLKMAFIAICSNNNISYFFNATGEYTVIVNASNAISSDSYRLTFSVEYLVTGVNITARPNPAKSNELINFNITKNSGSTVQYRVDFGDGLVIYNFDGDLLEFNRNFVAGNRQIILTANNSVSYLTIFYALIVQDKIQEMNISINADAVVNGIRYVALGKTKQLKVRTLNGTDIMVDWQIDGWTYHDKTIQTTGNTTITRNHVFNYEKEVFVNATARNLVSTHSLSLRFVVQAAIEGFTANIPDAVVIGRSVILSLEKDKGGNVIYEVSKGDGTANVTTTETKHVWQYDSPGTYRVTLRAFNQLSAATWTKLVTAQYAIAGLKFTRQVEVVGMNESFTIKWAITNGTDVTFRIRYGDGNPEVNVSSQLTITHTYKSPGKFAIELTAMNLVDRIDIRQYVTVEERITGLNASAEPTTFKLGDSSLVVKIRTSLVKGTGVTYQYEFDDNTELVSTSDASVEHLYSYPGVFRVHVTASNKLGKKNTSLLVTVEKPPSPIKIIGLKVSACPCVLGTLCEIQVKWEQGFEFNCELKFGDETSQNLDDTALRKPIQHLYHHPNTYQLQISCENSLGSVQAGGKMDVDEPLSGLDYKLGNQSIVHAVYGESLKVGWLWTAGSRIQITAELSDYGQLHDLPHNSTSVELKSSYFTYPGDFVLTVKARNSVSKPQMISLTIAMVQEISDLKLSINPNVAIGFPAMAALTMNGSHAVSLWSYGDGSSLKKHESGPRQFITSRHLYAHTGMFPVTVTVWNRLSKKNETALAYVSVQVPVTNISVPSDLTASLGNSVTFTVKITSHETPTNASYYIIYGNGERSPIKTFQTSIASYEYTYAAAGCYRARMFVINSISSQSRYITVRIISAIERLSLQAKPPAFAPWLRDVLPFEYPVVLQASNVNDSCLEFEFSFGDGESSSGPSTVSHSYPLPGEYTVTVRAFNPYSHSVKHEYATTKVKLVKGIYDVFLASNSPGRPEKTVTFVVFCSSPGNGSSFVLDVGNGENVTLSTPSDNSLVSAEKYLRPQTRLPFDPTFSFYSVVYNHTFDKVGNYKAKLMAWNEVSRHALQIEVAVTDIGCRIPEITIFGGGSTILSAPTVIYGNSFEMTSEVNVTCNSTVMAEFIWTVYVVDTRLDSNTSMPPNSAREIQLPSNVIRSQSSIIIPGYSLSPGVYQVVLKVVLNSKEGVRLENSEQKYIKISTPAVKAVIAGGTAISHGWQSKLVLDASGSHDPAYPSNDVLSFAWYCTQVTNVIKPGYGCFGNISGHVESERPVFVIREMALFESVDYKFTVVVTSTNGRQATAIQRVTVLAGDPPNIKIRCLFNCGSKVTVPERLALRTTCSNYASLVLEYRWSAYRSGPFGLETLQVWPDKALTSNDLSDAVIEKKVFEPDANYVLKVEARRKGGNWAFATYAFVTNSPPKGGYCGIVPQEGEELNTKFSVTCAAWEEEDTPLTYEILLELMPGNYALMWYGPALSNSQVVLAAGKKENNFTQNLIVRVRDVFGAVNDTEFTIKVRPWTNVDSTKLLDFTNGSDSILQQSIARGDLQGAVQATTVIASMLNTMSENFTTQGRIQVREVLAGAMSGLIIRDLLAVRQLSGSMEMITLRSDELTSQAQLSASLVFPKVAEVVSKSSALDEDPALVELACRKALAGVGSVITAASMDTSTSENKITLPRLLNSTSIMAGSIEKQKVPGENKTVIATSDLSLLVYKLPPEQITKEEIRAGDQGGFLLPSGEELYSNMDKTPDAVGVIMLELQRSPFITSQNSSITSSALSLVLKDSSSHEILVQGLSDNSLIDIFLNSSTPPAQALPNTTLCTAGNMSVHKVQLSKPLCAITVEILRANRSVPLDVYVRHGSRPTPTEYDRKMTLPGVSYMLEGNLSEPSSVFIPSSNITGDVFVGIMLNGSGAMNYTFGAYSSCCYFWDEAGGMWSSQGCEVGRNTSRQVTHCKCSHLTWFGAKLFIPPNAIDLSSAIKNFANFDESPALLATFCAILGMYLVALIWARRRDLKDTSKVGLVAVPDSDISDLYRYEVTVYTGRGKAAATTSNVTLIMCGELGESQAVTLTDDNSEVFQAGGIDSFFVTTPNPLGALCYIRIWHDNTGSNPSWYLNQVAVRNIDSNERFYFLCYRWFACDEGDGEVDRVLPVAGKEELAQFMYLFRSKATRDFSDAHLWFSIALRPCRSLFTRTQRVTCCLSLLLCTMLANVLWYQVPQSQKEDVIFESGFIRITWHELLIGIQSSLLVFPINLLIIQIFRNTKPRPLHKDDSCEVKSICSRSVTTPAIALQDITTVTRETPDVVKSWTHSERRLDSPYKQRRGEEKKNLDTIERRFSRKHPFRSQESVDDDLLTLLIETRLDGLYRETTPENKAPADIKHADRADLFEPTEQPSPVSIESFDYVDGAKPLFKSPAEANARKSKKAKEHVGKVLGFALVFALVLKKPQGENDEKLNSELAKDRQWLEEHVGQRDKRRNAISNDKPKYLPPDPSALQRARLQRFKERKMFEVIQEILFYALFVWVVLVVAYGHRDPNAHVMNQGLEDVFSGRGNSWMVDYEPPKLRNRTIIKFLRVSDITSFWNWTEAVLIPGLYSESWYNGRSDKPGFLADHTSWMLGTARMRQLRVKAGDCKVHDVYSGYLAQCNGPYSWDTEDTTPVFRPGWRPAPSNYSTAQNAWKYRDSSELRSLPHLGKLALYSGGGYAFDLGKKEKAMAMLAQLKRDKWVDRSTRAIFVEFTVYSSYTNLHCVGYLLLEVLPSGGTSPFSELLVTRIDRYAGNFMIFVLLCEILFVLFTVYFTYKQGKEIAREGVAYHFHEYWSWVELVLSGCSWTSIVLYFVRFGINKSTVLTYHKDTSVFVNFHALAASDQVFGYVYAFVAFFVSLKFLRLFRFNKRMSLLATTLKCSAKELAHFSIVFGLVFMAFVHFCYLIFSTELYIFHTVLSTVETLISVMLGKFSYERLLQTNRLLAPFMFFFYSIVVVFILINMFISIIIENFQRVKSQNDLQSNEYEIVDFMTEQFRDWLGWTPFGLFMGSKNRVGVSKTANAKRPSYKHRARTNQAEVLKTRVDRLVELIQSVHCEEDDEDFLKNDGEITYRSSEKQATKRNMIA